MSFHFEDFVACIPKLLQALPLTVKMTVISMAASIVFGILLAALSLSKNRVVGKITQGVIAFIRSRCSAGARGSARDLRRHLRRRTWITSAMVKRSQRAASSGSG